ncbi:MAG TPA: hypothetical protein DIT18_04445 [Pseudomonas sp.]|nr:hypothetical protein [Pseudomonas sp.]
MSQPKPQALLDVSQMNTIREDFLKQYNNTTQALLPSIREQLEILSERLLGTDRLLSDRVLSALIQVGNRKWDDVGTTLEEIRLRPGLDEAQRDAVLRSTSTVLEQDALRDTQRLETTGQEIADALAGLAKVKLPSVQQRTATLNELLAGLDPVLVEQKARMAVLDEQISAMTEVIYAFEAPNLQSILKSMIPTEAELLVAQKALVKGGADPLALAAAARTFVDKLSGVIEGRKLSDVIDARSKKVLERTALIDELLAGETRRKSMALELEQLPNVATLGGLRDGWLEQATSLAQGWTAQIQAIKTQTDLLGLAGALAAMANYLLTVRRCYEEA